MTSQGGPGHLSLTFFDDLCPVQAAGDLDGQPVAFRARGGSWSFAIAEVGSDPWAVMAGSRPGWQRRGDWACASGSCAHRHCAGSMPKALVRALIVASARMYLDRLDAASGV